MARRKLKPAEVDHVSRIEFFAATVVRAARDRRAISTVDSYAEHLEVAVRMYRRHLEEETRR